MSAVPSPEELPSAVGTGADPAEPSIVVGIGGSAGSIEATSTLIQRLPPGFTGAVVVVVHMAPTHRSALAAILGRAGRLPVAAPTERTPLAAGHVYVASPGRHLLVQRGWAVPTAGPRENGHLPAVDPLFRSLAEAYDGRAVGVVVSGARDDGTAGLHVIKQHGGTAFAQDLDEALFDSMPASAARHVALDGVLRLDQLAERLVELSARAKPRPPRPIRTDVLPLTSRAVPQPGDPATRYTCPDCGGGIYRHADGDVEQYRCSVGHAYSPESFSEGHARAVETALWAAARILGDRAVLMGDMQGRAERLGQEHTARRFAARRAEAERHADAVRALVESMAADVHPADAAMPTAG